MLNFMWLCWIFQFIYNISKLIERYRSIKIKFSFHVKPIVQAIVFMYILSSVSEGWEIQDGEKYKYLRAVDLKFSF